MVLGMKKLIAGNWKMNGTAAAARALAGEIADGLTARPGLRERCDVLICPPHVHIEAVMETIRSKAAGLISIGGQDCAPEENGAFTGDISAAMLADLGCNYVILGHSERRQHRQESDELIAAKAAAAHAKGLIAIICVGETEKDRDSGLQTAVVGTQLSHSLPPGATAQNTVIAYEPVWAIGTGKTATPGDVGSMHGFIRKKLKERLEDSAFMRILYGGSVKPDNAAALFAVENVDGGLIGGASLKAGQFLDIAKGT